MRSLTERAGRLRFASDARGRPSRAARAEQQAREGKAPSSRPVREQAGALERRRGAGVGQRRAGPRPSKRERGGEKRLGHQAAGQARKGKGEEGWAKSGVGLKMRKGIFFKYKSLFLL